MVQTIIKEYAKEVGMIGAIIADNFMNTIYTTRNTGYIDCLSYIGDLAMEFYEKYKYQDWNDLPIDEFPNEDCWDDVVIAWTKQQIEKL